MNTVGWFAADITLGHFMNACDGAVSLFVASDGVDIVRSLIVVIFFVNRLSLPVLLYMILCGFSVAASLCGVWFDALLVWSIFILGKIWHVVKIVLSWRIQSLVAHCDLWVLVLSVKAKRIIGLVLRLWRQGSLVAAFCLVSVVGWRARQGGSTAYEELDPWKGLSIGKEKGVSLMSPALTAALMLFCIELALEVGTRFGSGCLCIERWLEVWFAGVGSLRDLAGATKMVLFSANKHCVCGLIGGPGRFYRVELLEGLIAPLGDMLSNKYWREWTLWEEFLTSPFATGLCCLGIMGNWPQWGFLCLPGSILATMCLLLFLWDVYTDRCFVFWLGKKGVNWLSAQSGWLVPFLPILSSLALEGQWSFSIALVCALVLLSDLWNRVKATVPMVQRPLSEFWARIVGMVDLDPKEALMWGFLKAYATAAGVASCWCCYLYRGGALTIAFCVGANLFFWFVWIPLALLSPRLVVGKPDVARTKIALPPLTIESKVWESGTFTDDSRPAMLLKRLLGIRSFRGIRHRIHYLCVDVRTLLGLWKVVFRIALWPWCSVIAEKGELLCGIRLCLTRISQCAVRALQDLLITESCVTIAVECCGQVANVRLDERMSVRAIKARLYDLFCPSICESEMHIAWGGRVLDVEGLRLCDYGVLEGSLLVFGSEADVSIPREKTLPVLQEAEPTPLRYRTCLIRFSDDVVHHFVFTQTVLLEHLCTYIGSIIGTGAPALTLSCNGRTLTVMKRSLFDYGVLDRSTVDVGLALRGGAPPPGFNRRCVVFSDESSSDDSDSLSSSPLSLPPSSSASLGWEGEGAAGERCAGLASLSSSCRDSRGSSSEGHSDDDSCEERLGVKCTDDNPVSGTHGPSLAAPTSNFGSSLDMLSQSSPIIDRIEASVRNKDCAMFENAICDFNFLVDNHVAHFHKIVCRMMGLSEEEKRIFMSLAFGESELGSCFDHMEDIQLKDHIASFLTHRAVTRMAGSESDGGAHQALLHMVNRNLGRMSSSYSDVDKLLSVNMPFFREVMGILLRTGSFPHLCRRLRAYGSADEIRNHLCHNFAEVVDKFDLPPFPDEEKESCSAFPFDTKRAALFFIGRDDKGCHHRDDQLPYRDHRKINCKEIRLILLSLEEVLEKEYRAYEEKPSRRNLDKLVKLVTKAEVEEALRLVTSELKATGEELPSTKRDVARDCSKLVDEKRGRAKQELNYRKAAAASSGNRCRYKPPSERDYAVKKHYDHNNVLLEAQSYEMKGFVDKINDKCIPLDLLFPAGRTLRQKFGLPVDGPELRRDCPTPDAKLVFLLRPEDRKDLDGKRQLKKNKSATSARKKVKSGKTKGSGSCAGQNSSVEEPGASGRPHIVAPCVISISQAICLDLKAKLLEFHNQQPHIRDSTGSGRAFLRAPFIVGTLLAAIFPLVSMGANKAMLATGARTIDISTIEFANEVQNVLVNLTNRGIGDIRGEEPPKPTVGPDAFAFEEYLSKVLLAEDGNGHKYVYPDDCYEIFGGHGTYFDNAYAIADDYPAFFDPIVEMDKGLSSLPLDVPPVDILPDEQGHYSSYLPNRLENSSINRIAADAHYSRHQDCCEERGNQLISNIGRDGIFSQTNPSVRYPTNEQMIVLSWIIGEDSMCRKTAVDWWLGKLWLGGCVTESNNWHIQMAGVQYYGIQHSAGFLRTAEEKRSIGSRYIMTFRFMIDPNTHPRAYLEALYLDHLLPKHIEKRKITVLGEYKFTNVGEKARTTSEYTNSKKKPWLNWQWAKDFFDIRGKVFTDTITKKIDQTPRRRFKPRACKKFMIPALSQMNKFHREQVPVLPSGRSVRGGHGFKKPVRTIAVGKSPVDVVYHRTLVDHALSQSKLLIVNDADDVPCAFQPLWLHEDLPCLPATGLQTFQIPLKVNKQKKELINPDVPNAFQAARMYKNRITSYENHLQFWKRLRERCTETLAGLTEIDEESLSRLKLTIEKEFEDDFVDLFFKPLQSMGSGGSNQPTGATASQFDSLRSDAPHIVVSGPQSLRAPTNEALSECYRRQNPIAIFLNNKTVFDDDSSDDESIGNDTIAQSPSHCSERDAVSFLSYYCVSKFQSNTETLAATYNSDFSTTFNREQSIKFVRRNKYNLSHRKNSFVEFGFTPAFRLGTTISTIFNEIRGNGFREVIISENDKRSPNVPIEKVQASVLKRYQYETLNHSSDCQSKRLLSVQSAPGRQTDCECLDSLREFLSDHYVKDQKGLEWTTADFPESILDREQVLGAMIEDHALLDKLEWTVEAELQSRMARFLFDPKTAADIIVFTCAAQAGRGTGLHSCTIPESEMWPLLKDSMDQGNSAVGEPPSKKQRTSKSRSEHPSAPVLPFDGCDNGNLYTVPLMLEGSDYLPYSLQIRATPGSRDRDVSSAFLRDNLSVLQSHSGRTNKLDFPVASHTTDDGEVLTWQLYPQEPSEDQEQFLLHGLFMSTISRLTGNSDILELFPDWKRQMRAESFSDEEISRLGPVELALPIATRESVREFSMFLYDYLGDLKANLGPVVSKQHERFIPKRFKKECRTALLVIECLCKYFEGDVHETYGCQTVSGFVSSMSGVCKKDRRFLLIQTLVRAFSRSGNYQMEPSLYKLFHQVVLDVEGYLPGFAGAVTVESVFPGSGGLEGLASIHFDDICDGDINANKRADDVVKKRLQEMHRQFLTYFGSRERELHRRVAGLFIDDTKSLRWTTTGRMFDLCDVEHFCCKLYIVCMNSHPSRTISELPQCCNYYSWPRPNPKRWDLSMTASFKRSWEAFIELMRSNVPLSIPYQLQLRNSEFVDEDSRHFEEILPEELMDNSDDSPQNAIGLDEDNLDTEDPEGEEAHLVRTAF